MNTFIEDDRIIIKLDKSLFAREAIFKCLYWYTGKYIVEINESALSFEVIILLKNTNENIKDISVKVQQDFVDFNLRHIISNETKNIRDLLIAKAFEHFDTETK